MHSLKSYGETRNSLATESLRQLQKTACERRNVFDQLIEAVKYNSLGQVSHALYVHVRNLLFDTATRWRRFNDKFVDQMCSKQQGN